MHLHSAFVNELSGPMHRINKISMLDLSYVLQKKNQI